MDSWIAKFFEWYEKYIVKPMNTDNELTINLEVPNEQTDDGTTLYLKAKSLLGIDLTPEDSIPDYVACVAQLQEVHRRAFGEYIGSGAALYNTRALRDELKRNKGFKEVSWGEELPGDVWVFATGEDDKRHPWVKGHTGIVGKHDWMSNNSQNGLWEANYTQKKVTDYFITYCGFKPYVFRKV